MDQGEAVKKNTLLLLETLAYIEEHPEEWDQQYYLCRTGMCFAGTACVLAGCKPWYANERDGWSVHMKSPNNRLIDIDGYAKKKLGLTELEGDLLFAMHNELEDIRDLVKKYCAEDDSYTCTVSPSP
jgi:hypothetical protein